MEGGYAWLTLNYLLGKLGQPEGDTVAAIDLGGGSVQQAFALSHTEANTAPEGYVIQLAGGPLTYHVYVHRCGFVHCKELLLHRSPLPLLVLLGASETSSQD